MRVKLLLWLPMLVLGTTVAGQAATGVTLSPAYGHPSTVVAVSGTSFGASEAVDVYVDLVDTVLLVSSSAGSFSGSVTIPANATPGRHYITAIGRKTGDTAQTTFNVGSPWSQFGYSAAHLATNPWENTLSPSNVAAIGPKWINPDGNFGSSGATVAVNFGDIYVSTDGNGIEALSASTGSVLWSFATAGLIYASPTLSGGILYVGSESTNTLYALNATTGAKIWSSVLGNGIESSVAIANGIAYVGCNDGKVYALNASTGATLWKYTTGFAVVATPTVVNGVVYIGSQDANVYALNASTGALIWSYTTTAAIDGTAAFAGSLIYVASGDGNVFAIGTQQPNAGKLLWSYQADTVIVGSPAVANNTVYVGSADGNFYALDAVTGSIDWSLSTPGQVRSVAVANGVVYFTSGDYFYAVAAANGSVLTRAYTGNGFLGSPAVSDGVIYIAPQGSPIYAFSLPPNLNTNAIRRAGPPLPASLHPDLRLRVTP